jgi:hypothetical protein
MINLADIAMHPTDPKKMAADWDQIKKAAATSYEDFQRSNTMDAHTKAMQDHTAALKAGQHGGGQRVADALPSDLRGEALRQRLQSQKIALGMWD